jgi:hypothetical protein
MLKVATLTGAHAEAYVQRPSSAADDGDGTSRGEGCEKSEANMERMRSVMIDSLSSASCDWGVEASEDLTSGLEVAAGTHV